MIGYLQGLYGIEIIKHKIDVYFYKTMRVLIFVTAAYAFSWATWAIKLLILLNNKCSTYVLLGVSSMETILWCKNDKYIKISDE